MGTSRCPGAVLLLGFSIGEAGKLRKLLKELLNQQKLIVHRG